MNKVTQKEWEVAELISFGLTEKEISNLLGSSINTIKSHKRNIYNKIGCRNISDVTRWYIQESSGIRIEPHDTFRKLISTFLMLLVLVAEFSTSEFLRARVRVRSTSTRAIRSGTRARSKDTLYLLSAWQIRAPISSSPRRSTGKPFVKRWRSPWPSWG